MQRTDNLLGIPDGEEYHCRVVGYSWSHMEMWVKVFTRDGGEAFYIFFRYVICFSGTFCWKYAILHMGSEKEYLQFMAEMRSSGLSDEELRDKDIYGKLFIFESDNHQVRLVADSFSRQETLYSAE